MSINAGITVFPVRSTRVAPAGSCISPFRPTLANRPFSTRNAELSIAASGFPVTKRAPSKRSAPGPA